jgi:predicted amidohydrolase YtcJ
LTLLEALQAYTSGPANAAGWEHRAGKLAPGFFADLILLPSDPFDLPEQEIWRVSPQATMIAGQWVWTN